MAESYDLTKLDANSFEHLVNMLALRVLGPGHTGFGLGPDGGRDGYFEGEAPYPSETEHWSGRWYIQSKFHKSHLSKDPQKWLLDRIQEELAEFKKPDSQRKWPDNWIVATNIDPSGTPMTGAFDQAIKLVSKARPKLTEHFHIWGGQKILDLLAFYPEVIEYYSHFLTPGHVLTAIYDQIKDARAEVETILRFLIVKQFGEQQYTKLEQAGSAADTRPGIHRLFIDLPFQSIEYDLKGLVTQYLTSAAARCHRIDPMQPDAREWRLWHRHPSRGRVWFIKGGPGQGKSTIGQYFCQIQRASLILQEDGPSVIPHQRTLANEIRGIAEKAGFWPSVPRIPISIELKEFAQWLGQRSNNEPRGILTYLAERIFVGVEQKVLVGTLKRTLQSRSWFVVFDGLDEVPQDVKDLVALEVRNFLDNIVMETNADVFALCTSRPQGYSGQFSELDGPTIDLINLSPEQALECAKPVLSLGRTDDEASKSLRTLTSAIESNSVRELMTTPLQSHIMAVVVRDGSRPPERRWQLFTNFYQVIKRREANRNLPDKRLAKLLREDEQLLKTVHNRLGFILHARAETSKGAQTHLDRTEFKNLAHDAVFQMMETEIDSTVEVLMRATTDRLVLVSTPDDGDHVRFDIRPLQEFFAAEFLYESVDADELRHRIELVAGDSHWREVVHFLMSALIENDRRTELSVAIEVLQHLNEREDDSYTRLLSRRLGRGALFTARLLQEGVLEQDKRVREQFRKCLEPLTAFIEVEPLRLLTQISQPNSQPWLFKFLVDTLNEVQLTESVGAAVVLAHILPDNNERVEEVKNFFLSSPSDYISIVLTLRDRWLFSETPRSSTPVQKWFLYTTLKLLLGLHWSLLSTKGIRSAIQILRNNAKKTYIIAKESGLPENQLQLLKNLLYLGSSARTGSAMSNYGEFRVEHLKHDWTTGILEFGNIDVTSEEPSHIPGILQLVYLTLRFGKMRCLSDLHSLLDYVNKERVEIFEILPKHLQAWIPMLTWIPLDDQVKTLKSLNEEQFEILLKERQTGSYTIGRPFVSLDVRGRNNPTQWRDFLEDYPEFALYFCEEFINVRKKMIEPSEKVEFTTLLIDKILQFPTILRGFVSSWGFLLELTPPNRKQELRKAFLVASSAGSIDRENFWFSEKFHTFKLDLPTDAPLLPYLVSYLMMESRSFRRNREVDSELTRISALIHEFVDDVSLLKQVIYHSDFDNSIKAAATLMLLLHPEGDRDLEHQQQSLIEFYNPTIGSWYLRAITACLTLLTTEKDILAKSVMGNLLDVARADYEGSRHLQRLLALWRENSFAPVQTADVQKQWLTGT